MTADRSACRPTPLAQKLAATIAAHGPIGIDAYMRACLDDPEHGYYRTRTAIGRDGDFVTAPEISQVFGELIGLWAAVVWQQMGSPARFSLVELGPGRGTMLADALRATRRVPGFHAAAEIVLVEPNARLVEVQRATLAKSGFATSGLAISWHAGFGMWPAAPTILLANEVVDVLPVSQAILTETGWVERGVGIGADGGLAFEPMRARPVAIAGPIGTPAAVPGDIVEHRDCRPFVGPIAALARTHPLAALFIDYGYVGPARGDTLQAVRAHAWEHPLAAPGAADLTAHVDFAALAAAFHAAGLASDGPVTQAAFLGRLGIVERASRLMTANPAAAGSIETAVARLMAPAGMGGRFQTLGVRSASLPGLPGLEPAVDRAGRAP